jgi:hypothetical protein
MLEGKRNNVLGSFKGISKVIPGKTFGDDNFDSSEIISRVPIALRQKLFMECRELELFKLAMFVQI